MLVEGFLRDFEFLSGWTVEEKEFSPLGQEGGMDVTLLNCSLRWCRA